MKNFFACLLLLNGLALAVIAQPGSIDLTFNPAAGANQTVRSTAIFPNGRIVLGGDFSQYAGASRTRIAMATVNGANIATFNPGTGADNTVHAVAIQPSDEKIIISGMFNFYNGVARRGIARIDTNGTLDATFTVGTGFNGGAYGHYGLAIQPNGKILVGGLFTSYNGVSAKYIARLNTNGSLDAGFTTNTGTGANAQIYGLELLPNGKIVIGGSFTQFNGTLLNYIARLDSTGALDATFTPGTGTDAMVQCIKLLPNGQMLVGGMFTYYDGNPAPGIARINSNGTFDNTFNPGTGAGGPAPNVYAISVQPDGKIILTGEFTLWNGVTANRIVRLNANGSVDATFNTGTGFTSYAPANHLLPDGKILVNGSFTGYNGTTRNRICRINGNLPPDAGFTTSSPNVCGAGNALTVTDTTTNFPTSWLWSVNPSTGVTIANPTAASTTITFANIGAYTIKLVAGNGTAFDSTTKNISVFPLPTATITANGPTSFCNGGSVQLSANSSVSYIWSNGATTQTITASQSGNYYVQITDAFGCQSQPSNTITVVEDTVINPGICMVTVDSISQNNIIYWDKSSLTSADTFLVYRDTANNNFALIGKVPFDSASLFIDTLRTLYAANGDPNVTSWRYKISIMDTCGNIGPMSPYHQTMFFQNSSGNFSWNHYQIEGQTQPVPVLINYKFYRDDLSNGTWVPIQTLSASSTAYTDPQYATFQATASWRVYTDWTISCDPTRGIINTSRSNVRGQQMVATSVNELIPATVSIFPNPAHDQLYITSEEIKITNIQVHNVLGEICLIKNCTNKNAEQMIDMSLLEPGVYFITITLENGTRSVKKLVKN